MLLLLGFSLVAGILPQANATMTGSNFVTDITTKPSGAYLVDADSEGRIFVESGNDIYRSLDQGATFTKVLDGATATETPFTLFVDSRDYIYAGIWKTGITWYLYRSINNGLNWTAVLDGVVALWHMVEDNNGNLYVNTYSSTAYIYNSTDNGEHFNVWRDETGVGDHFHSVGVDIANNDIYTLMGDATDDSFIKRYNGTAWETITDYAESGNAAQPTDIWSDGSYVYFAPDGQTIVYRIPSGGSWSQKETVMDLSYAPQPVANFAFEAVKIKDEDIYLMGTEDGQLWGTWDGLRWVKIMDTGNAAHGFFSISNRRPIYVVERTQPKLYRLDIQKEDLIRLFYREYYLRRGSETNAENYVLEQRLWNGTNYVDLTHVALSNVQASTKGLTHQNYFNNSGFETGDKTNWIETTAPLGTVINDPVNAANGTYYYKRVHTTSTNYLHQAWWSGGYVNGVFGDIYLISFYYKANASMASSLNINLLCNAGAVRKTFTVSATTSWVRYTFWFRLESGYTMGRWQIRFMNVALESHLDSLMFLHLETELARGVSQEDSIQWLERVNPTSYFDGVQLTTNPSLTISGQTVSHAGTLTSGTESSATSLTGILTGAVSVTANIQGSGQAILRLTGTRVFNTANVILQAYISSWYYGRCYDTPIYPTEHYVLTNLQAKITSLSATSNQLTFTVSSPSGTTSTTKIYCGSLGKPRSVRGATTWEYNATTKILTVTVVHSSSTIITLKWKFSGDVNDDGTVNATDLLLLGNAYGSSGGPPPSVNWNQQADLNGDNIISALDLTIIGKNYGKTEN